MKKSAEKLSCPGLVLCGAGIDFLRDVTLGTLAALRNCDSLVYIHQDRARLGELLKLLRPCPKVVFAEPGGYPPGWKAVLAELKKGRRVAYLTYGHPLVFSEGAPLAARCRREGYEVTVLPAVSAADSVLAEVCGRCGVADWRALACADAADVASGRTALPDASLLIFCADALDAKALGRLFCRLEKAYAPGQAVYLVRCADVMGPAAVKRLKVGELRDSAALLEHRMTLVLPVR
jgi:uncharacterized protein YabN with tetrapyrrole methylase and pyrophosphatase domain